ncbi:MAG TPA: hypothetical protein PK539_00960 [Candidatus Paceibacterota bacterium]|nr:hypothetical protein [Candidatus Paceibacterota bacterium]
MCAEEEVLVTDVVGVVDAVGVIDALDGAPPFRTRRVLNVLYLGIYNTDPERDGVGSNEDCGERVRAEDVGPGAADGVCCGAATNTGTKPPEGADVVLVVADTGRQEVSTSQFEQSKLIA